VSKEAESEFKKFQTDVWDFMDENKIDGMKVDGVNFVKTATAYASVQDRDEFREWAKVNDDLWVPKEVKMISQVRTDGRDCEREAIFKMKWVLGESVPDSLFEDPRAKPNQPNEFAKLNFSETPTSSP
jgi:hypothetical protein